MNCGFKGSYRIIAIERIIFSEPGTGVVHTTHTHTNIFVGPNEEKKVNNADI